MGYPFFSLSLSSFNKVLPINNKCIYLGVQHDVLIYLYIANDFYNKTN